ncbi:MAG: GNAT family N-acetyltransferase [Burkholderiales bacterium PBB4]|nr:MAG: GNAT family N-acetyltransferase [Burkholderiales bacterium PBB4]
MHEFNENATGYHDGESFAATEKDSHGVVVAGISGYTWGGCCYITYLWVHEHRRGTGVGTALVKLSEDHARSRGCSVAMVASHSFQAPAFYERLGYQRVAEVRNHPVGHSNIVFSKALGDNGT